MRADLVCDERKPSRKWQRGSGAFDFVMEDERYEAIKRDVRSVMMRSWAVCEARCEREA